MESELNSATNAIIPALLIKNLSVRYGTKLVLKDVSLEIYDGDIVIITGKNGSGKSTLLNTVGRHINQYNGDIYANGINLAKSLPHNIYRHNIVYVPQGGLVINSLNVKQHLKLASGRLSNTIALSKIAQAYKEFPVLKSFSNKIAGNLSGGEKQILSFACASVMGGKLWMLDEPTSGISIERVTFLSNFIKKMNKDHGVTFLIVEHNNLFINDLNARVIELVEGVAVDKGHS